VARLNAIIAVGTNPGQIQEIERWVARLDRGGRPVGTQFFVYNLKYAAAEDVAKLLNEIYSDAPGATGSSTGPTPTGPAGLAPPGSAPDLSDEGGSGGGGGDDDSGSGEVGLPGGGGFTPASAPGGGSGGGSGPVKVVANRVNNSLLIRATPQIYETVESTLLRLDTAPLQVLIEATIVEVLLTDALRYGVQYFIKANGIRFGFNSSDEGGGDFGLTPSPLIPGFNFISTVGQSNVTIDALGPPDRREGALLALGRGPGQQRGHATVGDEVPITTRSAIGVEDADSPSSTASSTATPA
jgi:general secretion pathway protein D